MIFVYLSLVFFLFETASADQVKHLKNGNQALAHFVDLVRQAEKTIDIATYIFEPCHASTQLLIQELEKKAKSGVRVRILLDAISQKPEQREYLRSSFAASGFQLAFYSSQIGFSMNLRMHSKMLIVDGQHYIAGGRNLSDSYFSLDPNYNFIDEDLDVTGASAKKAIGSFEELWSAQMTKKQKMKIDKLVSVESFCGSHLASRVEELADYLKKNSLSLIEETQSRTCQNVRIYTDDPDFGNPKYGERQLDGEATQDYMTPARLEKKKTSAKILDFMKQTQKSLKGQNWVYLAVLQLEEAFEELRSRKVNVEILTNQDIEGDNKKFRDMMEAGISAVSKRDSRGSQKVTLVSSYGALRDDFELTPEGARFFVHAKSLVRDDKDVMVGSFNLDSRSLNTNLETGVQVLGCQELTRDVKTRFREIQSMYRVDQSNPNLPEKARPSALSKFLAMMSMILL